MNIMIPFIINQNKVDINVPVIAILGMIGVCTSFCKSSAYNRCKA